MTLTCCQDHIQKIYGLCSLKHHIVEMRGSVTDAGQPTNQPNEQTLKIELLIQWKLEAEFRNLVFVCIIFWGRYKLWSFCKTPNCPIFHSCDDKPSNVIDWVSHRNIGLNKHLNIDCLILYTISEKTKINFFKAHVIDQH